jgi:hypothetical protein
MRGVSHLNKWKRTRCPLSAMESRTQPAFHELAIRSCSDVDQFPLLRLNISRSFVLSAGSFDQQEQMQVLLMFSRSRRSTTRPVQEPEHSFATDIASNDEPRPPPRRYYPSVWKAWSRKLRKNHEFSHSSDSSSE